MERQPAGAPKPKPGVVKRKQVKPSSERNGSRRDGTKHATYSAHFEKSLADRGVSSFKTETDRNPDFPNLEPYLVETIMKESLENVSSVDWSEISGLSTAKRVILETIIYPMKRPDIFTGILTPPKGVLLFGPPGNGKTLIGKAIASKSGAKFFHISAASLTSKIVGEAEKLVRALFAVAQSFERSIIFIDEIDSILAQRKKSEHESTRRIKTEFLLRMDGTGTKRDDGVVVIGATNRPQEIDEAVRRRLVKRLYIPLPGEQARKSILENLLKDSRTSMSEDDMLDIAKLSKGYSGSDMYSLTAEAAMGPIRDIRRNILTIKKDELRGIGKQDFIFALNSVRPSVSDNDLGEYLEWNKKFGSFPAPKETT